MKITPEIHEYRKEHRESIRNLCCDVAYEGVPLEQWLPLPRDLYADLFTAYYTDYEPENCFVAMMRDRFAGYVLLARDTGRYQSVWKKKVLLPAVWKVITGRYAIPISAIHPLVSLGIALHRCGGLAVPREHYPGHLHINIVPRFQHGAAVSMALLSRAFQRFHELGVSGIHGVVMTSRAHMEDKYRRIGFRILKRCNAPRPPRRSGDQSRWLVIGMSREEIPKKMLELSSFRDTKSTLAHTSTSC